MPDSLDSNITLSFFDRGTGGSANWDNPSSILYGDAKSGTGWDWTGNSHDRNLQSENNKTAKGEFRDFINQAALREKLQAQGITHVGGKTLSQLNKAQLQSVFLDAAHAESMGNPNAFNSLRGFYNAQYESKTGGYSAQKAAEFGISKFNNTPSVVNSPLVSHGINPNGPNLETLNVFKGTKQQTGSKDGGDVRRFAQDNVALVKSKNLMLADQTRDARLEFTSALNAGGRSSIYRPLDTTVSPHYKSGNSFGSGSFNASDPHFEHPVYNQLWRPLNGGGPTFPDSTIKSNRDITGMSDFSYGRGRWKNQESVLEQAKMGMQPPSQRYFTPNARYGNNQDTAVEKLVRAISKPVTKGSALDVLDKALVPNSGRQFGALTDIQATGRFNWGGRPVHSMYSDEVRMSPQGGEYSPLRRGLGSSEGGYGKPGADNAYSNRAMLAQAHSERVGGGAGGGGGAKGGKGGKGFWGASGNSFIGQMRHMLAWQAMMIPAMAVIGGVRHLLAGDKNTDKWTRQLIGVNMSLPERMADSEWGYSAATRLPGTTAGELQHTYKEIVGGMGMQSTPQNAPLLQASSERAEAFALSAQMPAWKGGRALTRIATMQATADKDLSPQNKMRVYNKTMGQYTGILQGSSVVMPELQTAMFYAGPTALNDLHWDVGQTGAYVAAYIEQGMNQRTAGTSVRFMTSATSVEQAALGTAYLEAYHAKLARLGIKPEDAQRKHLLTPKEVKKFVKPEIGAKMALIESRMKSGDMRTQLTEKHRQATMFKWMAEEGIEGGKIHPHESQIPIMAIDASMPLDQYLAFHGQKQEAQAQGGEKNLTDTTELMKTQGQQAGMMGLVGSIFSQGWERARQGTINNLTQAGLNRLNTKEQALELYKALRTGDNSLINTELLKIQQMERAGRLSPRDLKRQLSLYVTKQGGSKEQRAEQQMVRSGVQTLAGEQGKTEAQWWNPSADDRQVMPTSRMDADTKKWYGKATGKPIDNNSLRDSFGPQTKLSDGSIKVTINKDQMADMLKAFGGDYIRGNYTTDGRTADVILRPVPHTTPPAESPNSPPHGGKDLWHWGGPGADSRSFELAPGRGSEVTPAGPSTKR